MSLAAKQLSFKGTNAVHRLDLQKQIAFFSGYKINMLVTQWDAQKLQIVCLLPNSVYISNNIHIHSHPRVVKKQDFEHFFTFNDVSMYKCSKIILYLYNIAGITCLSLNVNSHNFIAILKECKSYRKKK